MTLHCASPEILIPECIACRSPMCLRFGEAVPSHWNCPRCRLECIVPQPDDLTLSEIYNGAYFGEIEPEIMRAMKCATYAYHLQRLPLPARSSSRRRLLDCGAANGYLAEVAREAGWDAFAIEISEFGSECCERLLGTDRVFRGQVQDAFFSANPEGRFEAITMFDFIEHVRDPDDVLRWAKRRLVPGGTLLLTTPRVGALSWRLMGRHWFHYVREHLWFFSPWSLQTLLTRNGFEAVVVHAAAKAIAVGYALAHYDRDASQGTIFSPIARALNAALPERLKRQSLWCYLGEMVVLARVSPLHAST